MVGADDSYGTSSTIKSAILYALLRRIDATAANLTTLRDVEGPYGSNVPGQDMVAVGPGVHPRRPRQKMIRSSNNWATNRLIEFLTMDEINDELDDLGLNRIRLRRYMTGPGSPSAHGNSNANADYAGWLGQHRQPAAVRSFLRLVDENGGLSDPRLLELLLEHPRAQRRRTWQRAERRCGQRLGNARREGGQQHLGFHPGSPASDRRTPPASAAGRLTLSNGETVVYAAFVDEADG